MKTTAELFVCKQVNNEIRYFHIQEDISNSIADPSDYLAKRLPSYKNFFLIDNKYRYFHSTSWRYEQGRVILTYILFSDRLQFNTDYKILTEQSLFDANSKTRLNQLEKVLHHGLRHIAFLINQDKDFKTMYAQHFDNRSLFFFEQLDPSPAGKINPS